MHGPAHARPARTLAHWHTGSREASVGRAAVCRPRLHAACRTLPPSRMARRVCACLGASIWACWHSASGAVHGGDHNSASQMAQDARWVDRQPRRRGFDVYRLGGAADSASSVPLTTPRTIFPRTHIMRAEHVRQTRSESHAAPGRSHTNRVACAHIAARAQARRIPVAPLGRSPGRTWTGRRARSSLPPLVFTVMRGAEIGRNAFLHTIW